MAHRLKCPICGHTGIKVSIDTAACQLCGHNGAMQPFQPKNNEEYATQDGRLVHMPPQQVLEAVRVVQDHFSARGVTRWAFDGVQSRVTGNELPSLTLPTIKNAAAAFRHEVIPCVNAEQIALIAQALADKDGPGWGFMDPAERSDAIATVAFVVNAVVRGH